MQVDVVVAGAGVAGTLAALWLAEAGARVVLADPAPGSGASGRGSGHALTGVIEHPCRTAASLGDARTRELWAFCGTSAGHLGALGALVPGPQRWVALDAREPALVEASAATLERLGLPVRLRRDPVLPGAGPSLELDGGGTVDPERALPALVARAVAVGAVLAGAVDAVDDAADGVVAHLGRERVRAEFVVIAAGIGAARIDPFFGDKLVPIREQAVRTAPIAAHLPGAWRCGHGLTFFRQDADGRLLVGGCRWATPHLEVGEREPALVARVQERIEAFARRFLPPLAVEGRRAWIETHTCDGLPIVGPLPGRARYVSCTGFCGNDWGLGPAAARAVADGLSGARTQVPALFGTGRFL